MNQFWDRCIRRATELAAGDSPPKELLTFYAKLLHAQKEIYEELRSHQGWLPSGSLDHDLSILKKSFPKLLDVVVQVGPPHLADEARTLAGSADGVIEELLFNYWKSPSDTQFFAKAFLQPYARWLAVSGGRPSHRNVVPQENRCPFCGGRPQVSCLLNREPSAESGNRDLVCATCLTSWQFRRVVCASCLEERPFKLGYFQAEEYDHVRVETCDTCKRYIKGIDLTRLGLAVPLVDEVGAAALDIWAQQRGYQKIELNLLGL